MGIRYAKPPVLLHDVIDDLDAVTRALVALSQLAMRADLAVCEAEVNPLIVLPKGQGAIAVDALVRVA